MASHPQRVINSFLSFWGVQAALSSHGNQVSELLKRLQPRQTSHSLVRVGSQGDGGYLLPDVFADIGGLISPGVGQESSFELHFAELGVPCVLIDGSVDGPATEHQNFSFVKKFLSPAPWRADQISIADAIDLLPQAEKDLILQMDIEGSEWPILAGIDQSVLKRFRLIVLEVHRFDHLASQKITFPFVSDFFEKILADFVPVHVHLNNCCWGVRLPKNRFMPSFNQTEVPSTFELTLLRRDYASETGDFSPVPHPLDSKSSAHRRGVPVPREWRS